MITKELAEKLKTANLTWEPNLGDIVHVKGQCGVINHVRQDNNGKYTLIVYVTMDGMVLSLDIYSREWVWLPRLDQILAEIEKHGWQADSVQFNGKYACDIAYLSETVHTKYQTSMGETREEAVGKSLLWILGQKAGDPA